MSFIRCLGPVTLPLDYRRFMRMEVEHFKRKRLERGDPEWFSQDRIVDPNDPHTQNPRMKTYYHPTGPVSVVKPVQCQTLESVLSEFNAGRQIHTVITVASMGAHDDDLGGELPTALIIPYQVSEHHYLWVEGEQRQLLANHVYAFNQSRSHALLYMTKRQPGLYGKPCSLLNVCFVQSSRGR
jgi:hypothetical protein